MKKLFFGLLFVVSVFTAGILSACGEKPEEKKLSFSKTEETVYIGQTTTLSMENGDGAILTSENPNVATVENDVVTGVAEGKTTVTAQKGEQSAVCEITVRKPSVSLQPEFATMEVGQIVTISPTIDPINSVVRWSSDDPQVASVAETGVVSALKAGEATITAEMEAFGHNYTAVCEITVTNLIYTPLLNEDIFTAKYIEGDAPIDLGYENMDTRVVGFRCEISVSKELYGSYAEVQLQDDKLSTANGGRYKVIYRFSGENIVPCEEERELLIEEKNEYGVITRLENGDPNGILKKNWFSAISYDSGKNALKLVQQAEGWEPASVSFDIYDLLNSNATYISLDIFYQTSKAGLDSASVAYGLNKLDENGELTKNYTFTKTSVKTNEWVTVRFPIDEIKSKMQTQESYDCIRIGLASLPEAPDVDDLDAVVYMKNLSFGYDCVSVMKGEYTQSDFPELYDYFADGQFSATLQAVLDQGKNNCMENGTANLAPGTYTLVYSVSGSKITTGEYQISLVANDYRTKYEYGVINALNDNISIGQPSVKTLNSTFSLEEIGGRKAMKVTQVEGNYGVVFDDFDLLDYRYDILSVKYDVYGTTEFYLENGFNPNNNWNVIANKWCVPANVWTTVTIPMSSLYGIKYGGWSDFRNDMSRLVDLQIRQQGEGMSADFYISNLRVEFGGVGAKDGTDLSLPHLGVKNFSYSVQEILNAENESVLTSYNAETKLFTPSATGVYTVKYVMSGDDLQTTLFEREVKVGNDLAGKHLTFRDEFAADRISFITNDNNNEGLTASAANATVGSESGYMLKIENTSGTNYRFSVPYKDLLEGNTNYSKITVRMYIETQGDSYVKTTFLKNNTEWWMDFAADTTVPTGQWIDIEITKASLQGLGNGYYCYGDLTFIINSQGSPSTLYMTDILMS